MSLNVDDKLQFVYKFNRASVFAEMTVKLNSLKKTILTIY